MFTTIGSRIRAAADRATTREMEGQLKTVPISQQHAAKRRAEALRQLARETRHR